MLARKKDIQPPTPRRKFKRQPEEKRRQDLVQATMDCVCDLGLQATTVRNVAERAGVSNGLIRHHFSTKDHMIQAAYRATIDGMTSAAIAAVSDIHDDPLLRLRLFVSANLGPPVVDKRILSFWASFISLIHIDEEMARIHQEGYIEFRQFLEILISNLFKYTGKACTRQECIHYAVKIRAIIDGFWLEACLTHDMFETGELKKIAVEAVGSLIGISLSDKAE